MLKKQEAEGKLIKNREWKLNEHTGRLRLQSSSSIQLAEIIKQYRCSTDLFSLQNWIESFQFVNALDWLLLVHAVH